MSGTARFLCSTLALIASVPVSSGEKPQFTGATIADATVKQDALRTIGMIVHAKLKYDSLDLVDAQALPSDGHPLIWLPPGAGPATYERWMVTACSHKQPFLVVLWPAKEGGMMFQVRAEKGADS